jgi:hypothetical protein
VARQKALDASAIIAAEADRLRKNLGVARRMAGRLHAALHRLVSNLVPSLKSQPVDLQRAMFRYPVCLLSEALDVLPVDKALDLFETTDLKLLAQRAWWTDYLRYEGTPLYSLDELVDRTEAFIAYLAGDRDHLVKTGLPSRHFQNSAWLYWRLAKLYCVKTPGSQWPRSELFTKERGDATPYDWVTMPSGSPVFGRDIRLVPYEDADLLPGLVIDDARRIEADRGKLLVLKIDVLKHLCLSVRGRSNAEDLWQGCYDLVTNSLSASDIEFYLAMDRFFIGLNIRDGEIEIPDHRVAPGGLTNLLETIGHFEKELTVRTMALTRQALGSGIERDDSGELLGSLGSGRWAYLRLTDRQREQWDRAIDQFADIDQKESDWWLQYRKRIEDLVIRDGRREVQFTRRVPMTDMPSFKSTFDFAMDAYLNNQGGVHFELRPITRPDSRAERPGHMFQRQGEVWVIADESRTVQLKDRVGLQYIAALLAKPDHAIPVKDLIEGVRGAPGAISGALARGEAEESPSTTSFPADASTHAFLDGQAINQYRQEMNKLRQELRAAKENNDLARASELEKDLVHYERELKQAFGGGFSQSIKRASKAVSKAIGDALDAVERKHAAIGRHLRRSIQRGYECAYRPEQSIPWQL